MELNKNKGFIKHEALKQPNLLVKMEFKL